MRTPSSEVDRRSMLRLCIGACGAAAGTAILSGGAAAEQEERPAMPHIENADGGFEDLRGQEQVLVTVGAEGNGGNFAFEPAGIWIDPGTTVTWEWSGEGGHHNVATVDGPADLESDLTNIEGFVFEFEFTEEHEGITDYVCQPHETLDMKGSVAVGDDIETVEVETDDEDADDADTEGVDDADSADEDTEDTDMEDEDADDSDIVDEEADETDIEEEADDAMVEEEAADDDTADEEQEADDNDTADEEQEADDNDTADEEQEADDAETVDDSVPGFGIASGIAAIGATGYMAKRRLADDAE